MHDRFVADMDQRQLGLFKVSVDMQRILVDERRDTLSGRHVISRLQIEIRNRSVDGRSDIRTIEVQLSQVAICLSLMKIGLSLRCGCRHLLDLLLAYSDAR